MALRTEGLIPGRGMGRRPVAAVCMMPTVFETHFDVDRLAQVAELARPLLRVDLDGDGLDRVQVLFTGWGAPAITPSVLSRLPNLRAVFHCAGTVRSLEPRHLLERGVALFSAAEQNARPVAQYTIAMILLAGKDAWSLHRCVAGRDWASMVGETTLGNSGRTIGLLGFSRVGRQVAAMLPAVMDAKVLVADPYAHPHEIAAAGAELVSLDELFARSDVLSIHAPATEETRGIVDARLLSLLRDGATVVNTARGALVDHAALAAECASGRLRAILDVTDPEPLPSDSVLRMLPNVVLTPHIAGSLGNEVRDLCDAMVHDFEHYLAGGSPLSRINASVLAISA